MGITLEIGAVLKDTEVEAGRAAVSEELAIGPGVSAMPGLRVRSVLVVIVVAETVLELGTVWVTPTAPSKDSNAASLALSDATSASLLPISASYRGVGHS